MEIKSCETHGRKLMVEFKCQRCGKTEIRPLEDCMEEVRTSGFRALYDLNPPKGWRNGGFYYPLFCPECEKAYDLFMKGGPNNGKKIFSAEQ